MNVRKETRMLPVKMKATEKVEAGVELANAESELAALKLDAKAVATLKRKGIAEQQKLVTKISNEIRSGHRICEVPCEITEDMSGKVVKRLDTKAIIANEALTREEFDNLRNPPLINIDDPMAVPVAPAQKKRGKKGADAPAPGAKTEVDGDPDEEDEEPPPESRDDAREDGELPN